MKLLREANLSEGKPGRWPRRLVKRNAGPESVTRAGVHDVSGDPYFSAGRKRRYEQTVNQDVAAVMAGIRRWLRSGCRREFYPAMCHAGPEMSCAPVADASCGPGKRHALRSA